METGGFKNQWSQIPINLMKGRIQIHTKVKIWIRIHIKVKSWIRIHTVKSWDWIHIEVKVWIRIHIIVKIWIRIYIKMKIWIRIRFKVMTIRIRVKVMRIRKPSKKLSLYAQPTPVLSAPSHLGEDTELLVDKYRPLTCKSIIGQQGDRSNMNKLRIWLTDWNKNHLHKVCTVYLVLLSFLTF